MPTITRLMQILGIRQVCRNKRAFHTNPGWDHKCRCGDVYNHAGVWHTCDKCGGTWTSGWTWNVKHA
jgi:hypothetical protein